MGSGVATLANKLANRLAFNSGIKQNLQLAENYTNQLLENKKTVYSSFKDNVWGSDLANMQSISKFNKGTKISLCVIDIFSKYAWVIPFKKKKGVTTATAFQKILK